MEFSEVSQILRKIFLKYGKELFTDHKKLKAVLSDLLTSFPKENRLLGYVIEEGIVDIIVNDSKALSPQYVASLAERLSDTYAIKLDACEQVIDAVIFAVLGKRFSNEMFVNTETTYSKKATDASSSEYNIKFKNTNHGKNARNTKIKNTEITEYHYKYKPGQRRTQVESPQIPTDTEEKINTRSIGSKVESEYRIKFR